MGIAEFEIAILQGKACHHIGHEKFLIHTVAVSKRIPVKEDVPGNPTGHILPRSQELRPAPACHLRVS